MTAATDLRIPLADGVSVPALLLRPETPQYLLVLAHGAGAGMRHPFMSALSSELARVGVATFRYQFPYMEERRRVPDSPAVLTATVAAAVRTAAEEAPGLPMLAGGKSMGGRMASQAAAEGQLQGVRGIVFYGFPLHPPNKPAVKRGDHLAKVRIPMLFLQGTRDDLADLALLEPLVKKLGARATLKLFPDADHSFHVPARTGRKDAEVMQEVLDAFAAWSDVVTK